jgi:lysophospholipase L1-like esterase
MSFSGFRILSACALGLLAAACGGGGGGAAATGDGTAQSAPVATSNAGDCGSDHWVSAWQAPPTDAGAEDPGLATPAYGAAQTLRVIISPLGSGCSVRVHLSNRFGTTPVSFSRVRLARRLAGAAIDPATIMPVTFSGQDALTLAAGADQVSDPVRFAVSSLEDVAVSIAATDPGAAPTRHYVARQHSYLTMPGAGDHADDGAAAAFVQSSSSRPFVTGLDVLAAPAGAAVVTLGDSLTDGFQGPPSTLPEDSATLDLNQRYPDFLQRRIDAAGLALSVSNAGISGNRVSQDGALPAFGPMALTRVDADVLQQAGVRTVILSEGLNDIALAPGVPADQLEQAYISLIAKLHAAGLRVVQATLTPTGNAGAGFSNAEVVAEREAVNAWIRGSSPADAIVDFDAALRDPADPGAIAAQYDGGDGLHLNAAGYAHMADAIDLGGL